MTTGIRVASTARWLTTVADGFDTFALVRQVARAPRAEAKVVATDCDYWTAPATIAAYGSTCSQDAASSRRMLV